MIIAAFDTVENILGKGENLANQEFLRFPKYFLKLSFSGPFNRSITNFNDSVKRLFENVGQGENAGYQHFLLVSQCLLFF